MMKKLILICALFLIFVPKVLAQDEATDSSNLEDRLNNAISKPVAYIGSITDVTELTINLSRFAFGQTQTSGEIMQIMISEEDTEFLEFGDTTESLEFEDIAIGDFIIAMGYETREGILEAKRVLVSETPETEVKNNYFANIIEIGTEDINFTDNSTSSNKTLVFDEDVIEIYTIENEEEVVLELADIEQNSDIIIFSEGAEATESITSIFVIPQTSDTSSPQPESDTN